MKVFISWSGPRSRYLADALRGWLPKVIQSLDPWMSDQDIASGARWLSEVATELGDAKVGIVCVTPENQSNPWLVFEAGALSKTLEQTFVCPLLYDMTASQLTGPIAQFQAMVFDKSGVLKLLMNLNDATPSKRLSVPQLNEIFEVWWPMLLTKVEATPTLVTEKVKPRSTDELLEEILSLSREQLRRENLRMEHSQARDERLNVVLPFFDQLASAAAEMRKKGVNLIDALGPLPVGMTVEMVEKVFSAIRNQSDAEKLEAQALFTPTLLVSGRTAPITPL